MKGICSTQAVLAVCAALLLASCGGGQSGEAAEVAVLDVSGSDIARVLDVGLPDTPRVTEKDASADTPGEIDLSAQDAADAADVCIPDCKGMECGDDGCGGTCGQCDDGNACNGEEACGQGHCTPGQPIICDEDGVPQCWLGACLPENGKCKMVPLADGSSCDDGNACTSDEHCHEGVCVGASLDCDDDALCTIDTCHEEAGCMHEPVGCPQASCKKGECDPLLGLCTYSPLQCDDSDPCTVDFCALESGQCESVPIACPPCSTPEPLVGAGPASCKCVLHPSCYPGEDPCTEELCHPIISECLGVDKACNDFDPNTTDWCDPFTGACIHDCPDCCGEPCSGWIVEPQSGLCVFQPISCDDWNNCTIDYCNPDDGQCAHEEKDCDDSNACTVDFCEIDIGCVHQGVSCALSQNLCLATSCIPSLGCVEEDLSPYCDDEDPCTEDGCDPATGFCFNKSSVCDDELPCTDDFCTVVGGMPECNFEPDDTNSCEEGGPGTTSVCIGGECVVVAP